MNWIKKLFSKKAQKQCAISGVDKKPNPYRLICYRQGWIETRIAKNNAKYWDFEIEHNGLTLQYKYKLAFLY